MYLAIDTSGKTSGLALIQSGRVTAELNWQCERNHAVELLPRLDELLSACQLNITNICGIIVACGPGSFNGLRVGLGTAKGLAYGLKVPIAGISTLEAAAYQFADSRFPICAISPAGRNEISCAIYQQQNEWLCLTPEHITAITVLCGNITQPYIFGGEINPETEVVLRRQLGNNYMFCKAASSRIAALALLGEKRFAETTADTVATIQPLYLRRPHVSRPKSKSAGAIANQHNIAIIWDVDGTIADTAELHLRAWHAVFAKRSISFGRENFRKIFGLRNDMIIQNFLGEPATKQDMQTISEEKNRAYYDDLQQNNVSPMPGSIALLEELHKHSIPMAVASSAPRKNIEIILRKLGICHLFQAIVSGDDVIYGKPSPEIYQKAAEQLGVEAHRCIVIEDAVEGIAGACSAGMRSIGVAANHPRLSLRAANIVVDTLNQVNMQDIEKLMRN
ncbi:MAG: tRNA (adenosine(37)-N6)-threonylcarbamoyltransferase complex dimerization subunit type 1 TsaB [Dehalococcoidia bacterium]|nr:tRNA (adenosine(37)-N6)-threonylcarbamoyltransferase complex dimerization subunit type 1 TsaB [Dehalococcoidia bacterium]